MILLYRAVLISLCTSSVLCVYESETERERQEGRFRKDCSKYIFTAQPFRRVNTTSRLINLRETMKSEVILGTHPIQAYFVTSTDEHQSTDIENYEKRREYISGFSGRYGDVIITSDKAALWTDGRYHLQADEQIDCNWLLFREGQRHIMTMSQWLKKEFPNGARIGLNPKIVSEYKWNKLRTELKGSNFDLVALNVSLIDLVWNGTEREIKRSKPAFILDLKYTGKHYAEKVAEVRTELKKIGADAMVITSLEEVAWLLNIRGRDVPNSPFLRSYVILDMENIYLYANSSQLNATVHKYLDLGFRILQNNSVTLRDYADIWKDLRTRSQIYHKILVPSHCVYSEGASHAIYEHIFRDRRLPKQSPIIHLKALKNSVEIRGMQDAHVRDGVAVCDCFAYIEREVKKGTSLTEYNITKYLNDFRYEQHISLGNSFETTVGFASNAAYPYYVPTDTTDSIIFPNSTVVMDSGGQYLSGTTQVTRTVHYGTPTDEMKESFTRVLIGIIQFSSLTFPNTMKMSSADAVARASLWEVGLDYEHETGHGIGAFSSAYESPVKVHYDSEVSKQQVFKPGYFLTVGPGFYKTDQFGIRLQNVLQVVEKPWLRQKSGQTFLGFQTVTLVPFDRNLIKLSLLNKRQRIWLNNYNARIRELVGAKLKIQNKSKAFYWLMDKTTSIPERDNCNSVTSGPVVLIVTSTAFVINTFVL